MKRALPDGNMVTFECGEHRVGLAGGGSAYFVPVYVDGLDPFRTDDPTTLEPTGEWTIELSAMTCPEGDTCTGTWRVWVAM